MIPQAPSSYAIEPTCQIENLGWLLEQLPPPFGIFDPTRINTPIDSFVEVGAFTGPTYSNVWQFATAGWPGIMIEPMPSNLSHLLNHAEHLPNIIVEPVACGECEGSVQMFFEREGSRLAKPGELQHTIPVRRLDDILEFHGWPPDFAVLVVDVEDQEQGVLKGFSLHKWHPKLCIVESHAWQRDWIHNYFSPLYRIYSEDNLNTLFVRKDWCP